MILDASAVFALLREEPGSEKIRQCISDAARVRIGAPTLVECHIVATRRYGSAGRNMLAGILYNADIQVVGFTADHWRVAAEAYDRYGKGQHPASLNFGDCMSYAVAKLAGEKLLYVGNDFRLTDVEAAL